MTPVRFERGPDGAFASASPCVMATDATRDCGSFVMVRIRTETLEFWVIGQKPLDAFEVTLSDAVPDGEACVGDRGVALVAGLRRPVRWVEARRDQAQAPFWRQALLISG